VPPQVASTSRKPLSIALEEIAAEKITFSLPVVAEVVEVDGETAEGDADKAVADEDLPGHQR
ncbi:MAG: DNA-directed RNA polymerase subunit omega, partial [Pseudonocardiaceae bacterium]